ADVVVAMKEGKLASEGSVEDLRTSGFDLAHLIRPTSSTVATELGAIVPLSNGASDKELVARDEADVNTNDANDEAQNSYNSKGWHPYLFWAHHAGNHRVVISLSFCLAWTAVGLGQSGYAKEWSESEGNTNSWIGGYTAFSFAFLVLVVLAVWHWCRVSSVEASISMHKQELKAIMKACPSYLHKTPAGRIINRFSQDMNVVIMTFPLAFINVFTQGSSLVGSMILVYVA
ncbi:hypothetical protein FRC07_014197, partial [Ceratobasidium sp. 392]